ncbi:hypothetical protein [Dyella sp.]|uniref:hypothetical protein n=1 Tax=Dyella sp. TaxID=1869338 RepID=UPI002D7672A8|nr:hypothetical protein [Dyella sp.]HET7332594.1 hypothetical protein [Dyella sp.]
MDLFDSDAAGTMMWHFPHAQALDILKDYLTWATAERMRRHFLPPSNETLARTGFAELARPPMNWNKIACGRKTGVISYKAPDSSAPPPGAFWGWCLLGADRPLTLTRLSALTHRRLAEVAKSRFEQPSSPAANAKVIEKFIPPLDVAPGADRWLHLPAVDPRALHTCVYLADAVCEYMGDIDELDLCRSPVVQKSNALDCVTGRGLLNRALDDVLVKGFEQGLDALCSVHLKQPSQMPVWVAPVAEIAGHKGHLEEIRIGWVSAPPLVAEPTPEMKKTRRVRAKKAQRARGTPRSAHRVSSKHKVKQ